MSAFHYRGRLSATICLLVVTTPALRGPEKIHTGATEPEIKIVNIMSPRADQSAYSSRANIGGILSVRSMRRRHPRPQICLSRKEEPTALRRRLKALTTRRPRRALLLFVGLFHCLHVPNHVI